jgi:hypothetical protein
MAGFNLNEKLFSNQKLLEIMRALSIDSNDYYLFCLCESRVVFVLKNSIQ